MGHRGLQTRRYYRYDFKKPRRLFLRLSVIVALLTILFPVLHGNKAWACPNCGCVAVAHGASRTFIVAEHTATKAFVTAQFELHRQLFIIDFFFKKHLLPAMMMMTEQLSVVAMQQMMSLGAMFDAKHQQETERLFQQLTARAHKDYQPSTDMCTIGTAARGLGSSYRNGELTAHLLAQHSIRRQMGNANVNAAPGPDIDRRGRLTLFIERYCDINDNNRGLEALCENSASADSINKDVDFVHTVYNPLTLDIDFSDDDMTGDEQDVMALARNLYAHDVFLRIPQTLLEKPSNQDAILDMRSVVAKRSVAEHSFDSIVGMKTAGTGISAETGPYLQVILQQLGIEDTEETAILLGDRPSYHAQMEFLTKKIYQNPSFYVNLYDKPVNVARKGAAIRAISLMQNMDMFKSRLRNEAMLSVLLELELAKEQRAAQNLLNKLRTSGEKREP